MTPRATLLAGSLFALASACALAAGSAPREEKGTFLGLLFAPRAEPAPAKPAPARTGAPGVVVTHVLADSPAARAKLRRGDILLEYDHKPIRNGGHLAQLIRDDKPARKVQILYQRGARVLTAEAVLTLGPPLTLAGDRKGGALTQGGVSVWVAPLASGKMKVTIEYYATGKRQTVSCEGGEELARTMQKLPDHERGLVRQALQRLRSLNTQGAK
jgi:membrane-associated protease RseP (regulator of RpoE activity)